MTLQDEVNKIIEQIRALQTQRQRLKKLPPTRAIRDKLSINTQKINQLDSERERLESGEILDPQPNDSIEQRKLPLDKIIIAAIIGVVLFG